jgi:hypothetical protein
MLLLPCLCGGGGGGIIEDRLLGVLLNDIGGDEISRLLILGGRPDIDLDEPRAGGTGGNDIVDGLVSGVWWLDPLRLAGLLDGGGGGARALSERGLPISIADIILELSSSAFGDKRPVSFRVVSFESDTSWLCRLASGGAGGVLRRREADGEGGSGVLPADSLSKMLSLSSDSWLARAGAGGRGLLRSVCER